jgi:hypothetical protein
MGAQLHGDAERVRIIDSVNNANVGWTAHLSTRWAGQPIHSIKRQLGVLDVNPPAHKRQPLKVHTGFDIAALPESFDSRTQVSNMKLSRHSHCALHCDSPSFLFCILFIYLFFVSGPIVQPSRRSVINLTVDHAGHSEQLRLHLIVSVLIPKEL